jgi:hypothetical protein
MAWWATLAITVGLFVVGANLGDTGTVGARSQAPHQGHGDDRATASSASSAVVAASDAPTLTEIQTLQLQNLWLARDLAQARLEAFVHAVTVPGYDLLGSGAYVKQEKAVSP